MKTIQIEADKLKPNPFKKFINKGKLNEEIIEKLIEGYKQTIFHDNLCGRENKEGEVELIYGHHRLEAVKRFYGKNYKITLKVYSFSEFSDKNMLIDMVRENLTQRDTDFQDKREAILLAYNWKHSKSNGVKQFDKVIERDDLGKFKPSEDSYCSVAKFLSNQGKAISYETVRQYLKIEFNVEEEIKESIGKVSNEAEKEKGEKYPVWYGNILSDFPRKLQNKVLDVLKNCKEQRRNQVKKLFTDFRKSSNELQNKVLDREIDLTDVPIELLKEEIKKKAEEEQEKNKGKITVTYHKKYLRDAGNKVGDTNDKILKTCAYLNGLESSGILYELDWNTLYRVLEAMTTGGNRYSKFGEKIMSKL